ncbi:MAG: NADH-quinone oxidoreductase subunit C [Bacteroidia bacterium]|nr:NADH-quinone oxidoreductase subunit C [Bacteroidia bacterium]
MEFTKISEKLNAKFGDGIISIEESDMPTIVVDENKVHELIGFLKTDTELQYHFLTTLCGLHYPGNDKPIGIMIQLHNLPKNKRIRVKSFTKEEDSKFKTFTDLFPAANWMERETYDFFGIKFDGHPDLRRILNMDSMVGWPLRKEHPLEDQNRYDKDDKMFGR